MKKFILCLFILFYADSAFAQNEDTLYNIKNYFDTTTYVSGDIRFLDFADKADGYWLFLPQNPQPDTAEVIVFLHGYGGYNPMIYGKWIKHLVRQGNIVVFPRYQKNMMRPRPDKFAENTAEAVRAAQKEIAERQNITGLWNNLTMVGHSYGGVTAADLAANYESYNIPKPRAIMLVSPGTAWLKKGRLDSYENIPADTKIMITVSENDYTTGDEFAILVFETARNTKNRVLYRQFTDPYKRAPITAGHNESYSVDLDFDAGFRNYTSKRALRISQLNALDYNGYWRLFDNLIACQRTGVTCDWSGKDFNLGKTHDGVPLGRFEVIVP